jgi:GNAT superfamily N-acetyltransferase
MNLTGLRRDSAHVGLINALVARAIARLQLWLGIHVFRVNLRPLPEHPAESVPPEGIRMCVMRLEELLEASADAELGLEPEFIRRALEHGDLVVGAFERDRLVGLQWRTSVAAPFFEDLWIRTGPRYHYVYKSFVRPSHRGMRIHSALSRLADRYSAEKGCIGELGVVNIANVASLGAAKSLGRRRIGYAGYVTLFGHCLSFRTAAVKALGIVIFTPRARVPIGLVPAQG